QPITFDRTRPPHPCGGVGSCSEPIRTSSSRSMAQVGPAVETEAMVNKRLALAGAHKVATAAVLVGVVVGGNVVQSALAETRTATVVKVVDGDTSDGRADGG